ncbi:hypothetical protein SAMN05216302_10028 [Nitrosomonas aestuarii]|uniref:Uncharacterized protein n=1 Tax=Nitrosomonas aestuarii TaxID=52441 RepID=A0A1I3XNK6_9PROT|nr:hypothetical protein SAMN05216302_10028 [Nitrosomonas aestuarii]
MQTVFQQIIFTRKVLCINGPSDKIVSLILQI